MSRNQEFQEQILHILSDGKPLSKDEIFKSLKDSSTMFAVEIVTKVMDYILLDMRDQGLIEFENGEDDAHLLLSQLKFIISVEGSIRIELTHIRKQINRMIVRSLLYGQRNMTEITEYVYDRYEEAPSNVSVQECVRTLVAWGDVIELIETPTGAANYMTYCLSEEFEDAIELEIDKLLENSRNS